MTAEVMVSIDQAIRQIIELNRYDDDVIGGIQRALKEAPEDKFKLLRLRPNGIDLIVTTDVDYAKEKFKHWNATWLEL